MTVWALIWDDRDYDSYPHVQSVWTSEQEAKAAHKRQHPRSKLAEPRCSDHDIERWVVDSDNLRGEAE